MTTNRVLSFLAHPDDAEFLCAGTLARLVEAGWELHLVTVTAGDCGTMTESAERITAIRTEEAKRAAAILGATYHCLGERDGRVVFDKPTVQKAIDLCRAIAPSLVFTHARDDYMMDHEITSQLARAASFIYGAPNVSALPLHSASRIPYLYYCDPIEAIDPLGHLIQPTTVVDITAELETKAHMLACHASQRDWLRAHHGADEYIEMMRRHAALRGALLGVWAAEAFVQHRGHAYPADDLLAELFSAPAGDRLATPNTLEFALSPQSRSQ
jgi:LmbE family N-acetylglucosaminyl deacetylase